MTGTTQAVEATVCTHEQSDGYTSHYRRWGRPEGEDVIVLLHGGISHAGWQAPLGERIASTSETTFIALDRRGSGLNTQDRGHLLSAEREIEDVVSVLRALSGSFTRVHMAGWCFGGEVAAIAAADVAGQGLVSSLILVAPGFLFNERYSDVLRLSMQAVFDVVKEFGLTPDPVHAFVPVPLQPTDFTTSEEWLRFVDEDTIRLQRVTANTIAVWDDLANQSRTILSDLGGIPVLAVFGGRDRLVDNARVEALLTEHIHDPAPQIETLDAHHAIQFDEPDRLTDIINRFVSSVK